MTVRNLEPNSEAPAINASDLRGRQLQGYTRYHQSRLNLLLHIVLVPLFLAGNVALLVALLEGRWTLAIGALVSTVLSIAIQGRAHSGEPVPPEPFTSPGNAVARILLEQWVTFPRFVLSGGWSRALRRRST
ncbi:MAG: terminase [Steroidobacteraceae bacterium]